MDVIKGGEEYLQEQKPKIIIEIHPDLLNENGYSVESLCSKLSYLGYDTIYNSNQSKKLENFSRRQMNGYRHFIVE